MKTIDLHLKSVLANFCRNYLLKREAALAGIDFEASRDEMARVKDQTLERLDEWLKLFESQVHQRGSRVYRAGLGAEANRLVLRIMKECGAEYLVKSKSMVSEETGLNSFLERQGIAVRETDLGEWIIQLRHEQPTHMVMPAIHLTREEVARVFRRNLKKDVSPDIPVLVELARQELRRDIWRAGAALMGANALIAENGSVMVVTNEGNGRLVSLIPPVRIVLASIEKILPTIQDALLLLKLLPPNATGQTITSYVSFLAPSSNKPVHIILLDNHRSEVLADPLFRPVLRCLKCSACLNVCPVYQILGGKKYGYVYMGGIGTLLTAWIHGLRESRKLADLCLGCHRCEAFCAAKIPIADLIIALRERLNQELGKNFVKKLLFDVGLANPPLMRGVLGAAGAAKAFIADREGFTRQLPWPFGQYVCPRAIPAPARPALSERARKDTELVNIIKPKAATIIFTGCLVEYFYPEIGEAALRVLTKLGQEARLAESVCCGFPAFNSGFFEAAAKSLRRVFEDIKDAEHVLTLCPTCATMLKHHGREILAREEARRMEERVLPISQYLVGLSNSELKTLLPSSPASVKVTYHDSCHHKNVLSAAQDSRSILELTLGQQIREMENAAACCGFGGFFSVSHTEVSASLLEDKLDSIQRSGAGTVALDCPGCLLQIRGGLRARKATASVRHTIQIIDARLSGKL